MTDWDAKTAVEILADMKALTREIEATTHAVANTVALPNTRASRRLARRIARRVRRMNFVQRWRMRLGIT